MRRPVRALMATGVALLLPLWLLASCGWVSAGRRVVVYTSVDQVYAEPILKTFEQQTGIRVQAVYDVEATKTVGLVQRLVSEKNNPRADVFWNGEFLQTLYLKEQGALAPTTFSAASALPANYVDPQGYWAAFGGRARVILVNTRRVASDNEPASTFDLLAEAYPPDTVGMAYPMFGTTSTEAAALYALLGADQARQFYQQVAQRGIRILDGNSVVRDQVASGQLAWGLTDTDDACGAIERGAPVKMIFPNQADGQPGTLMIPNTVARIAGGPNPESAQALIDYLLSPEVEARLVEMNWIQVPSRALPTTVKPACAVGSEVRGMQIAFDDIYQMLETARADLQVLFVR